jgi:Domain of unknown function (DUF4272)
MPAGRTGQWPRSDALVCGLAHPAPLGDHRPWPTSPCRRRAATKQQARQEPSPRGSRLMGKDVGQARSPIPALKLPVHAVNLSPCLLCLLLACFTAGCGEEPKTLESLGSKRVSKRDDPTATKVDEPDPRGDAIREASLARLEAAGFHAAKWLPTSGHRAGVQGELRPPQEVAARLLALHAVCLWVLAPEEVVPSQVIEDYISRNKLGASLTGDDRSILQLPRREAAVRHRGTIGWRQESMWALAWVLGFECELEVTAPLISDEVVGPLLAFLPKTDGSIEDFLRRIQPRGLAQVAGLEDEFYCAHNAVRSAQMGHTEAVPQGFDPMLNGGAVHERRHGLSWVLSPSVPWDDTDLST